MKHEQLSLPIPAHATEPDAAPRFGRRPVRSRSAQPLEASGPVTAAVAAPEPVSAPAPGPSSDSQPGADGARGSRRKRRRRKSGAKGGQEAKGTQDEARQSGSDAPAAHGGQGGSGGQGGQGGHGGQRKRDGRRNGKARSGHEAVPESSESASADVAAGEAPAWDAKARSGGRHDSQHRASRGKFRHGRREGRGDTRALLGPHDRGGADSSATWWADRWVEALEKAAGAPELRTRLLRGRVYARRGQVSDLEIGPNGVMAKVQGSRPKAYQVRIELNRLRRETWGRVIQQLAGKAVFSASLLAGDMPQDIEEAFWSCGARLFPAPDNDLRARCSCPDPLVPCKHVAAVHYVLADALQRDPFLLFALRGKSREQFLQDLREMRGRDVLRSTRATTPQAEDLTELRDFWKLGRLTEAVTHPIIFTSQTDPARLLHSLGEPQLEGVREGLVLPILEATYRHVSELVRRFPHEG